MEGASITPAKHTRVKRALAMHTEGTQSRATGQQHLQSQSSTILIHSALLPSGEDTHLLSTWGCFWRYHGPLLAALCSRDTLLTALGHFPWVSHKNPQQNTQCHMHLLCSTGPHRGTQQLGAVCSSSHLYACMQTQSSTDCRSV